MSDKFNINNTPNESPLEKKQKSDIYKNNIKNTLEKPMDTFRKSRVNDHKRFLLEKDPKAIEKIKSLFKNVKIERSFDKRVITLNLKNKYTIVEPNLDKISDEIYSKDVDVYKIEPAFTNYVNTQ